MNLFQNLPIRQKLTFIVLLTCGLLVMLMAIFFMADKFFSFRRNMVSNITTLAQVIGTNSTAAITFDDAATGEEILSAVSAEPNVTSACIFRPNGQKFASYPKNPDGDPAQKQIINELMANTMGSYNRHDAIYTFSNKKLILAKPVIMNHKLIGCIVIRANIHELYKQLIMSGTVAIGLMAALVLTAQLITARLHRTISAPLLNLVSTMDSVTADKNYALRAEQQSNDELGILINGFNDMLSQIQQRDQQLEQHRHQLEDQVAQRTHELIRSNEKLKQEMEERKEMQDQLARAQRMEAVGTLAAGVAHDLNNILSGIVSYPDLLLTQLPADSQLRKPLNTIHNSGQKAAAIVQDMLTLARRGVTTSEVVNLKAIVADYLNSPEYSELTTHHPDVRIIKRFSSDLMNITGSPVHLGKTIMNLVSNATEAIDTQGTVTITLNNKYIDTPIKGYDDVQQGDYVLLKISDTGHGIALKDLERIFEPFYTKKKMGRSGTGLGMAVVWGTVKDHQGYINVNSREGQGTTFSLYFPATRLMHKSQKHVQLKDFLGAGQSILVVDDIEEQRKIASDILQSLNYTVITVDSGEAAIEHLKNHHADLLLLDMIMDSGMDGLETYKRIVAQYGKQSAIIASGYSESERVKKAQSIGAGAYLRKPYTIENLAQAVYNELYRKEDGSY